MCADGIKEERGSSSRYGWPPGPKTVSPKPCRR
jgi:hypothetical protein